MRAQVQYNINANSESPAATNKYWCPSSIYVSGACRRIIGHDVASQIAAEQELARGGQQSRSHYEGNRGGRRFRTASKNPPARKQIGAIGTRGDRACTVPRDLIE